MNGSPDSDDARRKVVTAVAVIETIGTAGALVGIGWRAGDPVRVFRLAGHALIGRVGALGAPAQQLALLVGLLHHVCVAMTWGALFGWMLSAPRVRRSTVLGSTVLAPLLTTALFASLQLTELPPILRIGYTVTFDHAQMVAVSVAVALSLFLARWATAAALEPAS